MLEKRSQEASYLRSLIEEQWQYIQTLTQHWQTQQENKKQRRRQVNKAIEKIVDATDDKIRIITDYHQQLRSGAKSQIEYVAGIAQQLATFIAFEEKNFKEKTLLSALFYDQGVMHKFFSHNVTMQDFIKDNPIANNETIYGLITFKKVKKVVFKPALRNGQVINDVKQKQLSFNQLHFFAPSLSQKTVISSLRHTLHCRIEQQIKLKLNPLLSAGYQNMSSETEPLKLQSPSEHLDFLKEILAKPKAILTLQPYQFSTNRYGIIAENNNDLIERNISFSQVNIQDGECFVILPISYKL